MNVEISQSQIERLNALAARTGKGTDELVQEAVSQMLARNADLVQHSALTGTAWEQELDSLVAIFPHGPVLPDEAMQRESWYPDR